MEEKLRFGDYNYLSLFFREFEQILKNFRLYNGFNNLVEENCKRIETLIQKLKKRKNKRKKRNPF
jgi:hypothetical protein